MANILIIDDEISMREVLAFHARELNYAAWGVENLLAAEQILEQQPMDLVFLDVRLPDGDGLEALPRIKASAGNPEVVIITGLGSADGAALAIKNGAWDYITKPFRLSEITLLINRTLEFRQACQDRDRSSLVNTEAIVGQSRLIKKSIREVAQSAANTANVLIQGETGTGKELFARAIHENCRLTPGRYVVVDCAAMPESLTESVLFGHARGAFTGAEKAADGLVKGAHQGTLFLDEVGELPLSIQKAFLRVLQERRFRPVGGSSEVSSDFRLISATNRDLDAMVAQGRFRSDLLHRLRTVTMTLPPLRERKEDIKDLASHYLDRLCQKHQIPAKTLLPETLAVMASYDWPGNVRELINSLEKAILSEPEFPLLYPMFLPDRIRVSHASRDIRTDLPGMGDQSISMSLGQAAMNGIQDIPSLKDFRDQGMERMERVYLRCVLNQARSLDQAAQIAGISKNRLYFLIRKHRLARTGVVGQHWC